MKKLLSILLSLSLVTAAASPVFAADTGASNAQASLTERAVPSYISAFPAESASWRYAGGGYYPTDKAVGTNWVRGNAFNKNGNGVETNTNDYKTANAALNADEWLKDTRICILYLSTCMYSKSYLPKYKQIIDDTNSQSTGEKIDVLLVDILNFRTGSTMPYYNATGTGAVSPIILYKDKDGNLGGVSGVHSTAEFEDILKKAGYSNIVNTHNADKGYTKEEQFDREAVMEVNRERLKENLIPLSMFKQLSDAAKIRSTELPAKMSHTRPDETPFYTVFEDERIGLSRYGCTTGENVVAGAKVPLPHMAVAAWMQSPGHRANIMHPDYRHVGHGYTFDEKAAFNNNWAQLFFSCPSNDSAELSLRNVPESVNAGVPICDMGIDLAVACQHVKGEAVPVIPLIDEMCTGFDMSKTGVQHVTVKYGDRSIGFELNVGGVEPVTLAADTVTLDKTEFVYDGTEQFPAVTVSNPNSDALLMEGYSYTVSYQNNIDAGTAKAIIKGKGNYTGTVEKSFTILPASLENAEIIGVDSSYEYTSKPIKPSAAVKLNGMVLVEGVDYDLQYGENVGIITAGSSSKPDTVSGTGTVTAVGKGNCTGSLSASFDIKAGDTLSDASKLTYLIIKKLQDASEESVYAYWKSLETGYPTQIDVFANEVIGGINGRYKESLAKSLSCSYYPKAATAYNGFMKFYNERTGINAPVSSDSAVKVGYLSGDDIKAGETASLNVSEGAVPAAIDITSYDVSSAAALDISLSVDGVNKEKLVKPVTIKMPVPTGIDTAKDISVLHYANGNNNTPEVLGAYYNAADNTISFATTSFSTYVIANTMAQPVAVGSAVTGTNGLNLGEDKSDYSPTAIKLTLSEDGSLNVGWSAPALASGLEVKDYSVAYSANEDMSDAKEISVSGTGTSISGINKGVYYLTVTANVAHTGVDELAKSYTSAVKSFSMPEYKGSEPLKPEVRTQRDTGFDYRANGERVLVYKGSFSANDYGSDTIVWTVSANGDSSEIKGKIAAVSNVDVVCGLILELGGNVTDENVRALSVSAAIE